MGHTVRFTLSEGTGDGVCEKLCALRRSLRYFARLLPIPIFCARRDFLVLRLVSDMPRTAHTAPPGNPKHVSMIRCLSSWRRSGNSWNKVSRKSGYTELIGQKVTRIAPMYVIDIRYFAHGLVSLA